MCIATVTAMLQASTPITPVEMTRVTIGDLTAAQIQTASRALRQHLQLPRPLEFALIEPELRKDVDGATTRQSLLTHVVAYDRALNQTLRAYVDPNGTVVSTRVLPGVQPKLFRQDLVLLRQLVTKDARVVAALARRGLHPEHVHIVPLDPGAALNGTNRTALAALWYRDPAARLEGPIEGVVAEVDLTRSIVLSVQEDEAVIDVAASHSFDRGQRASGRPRSARPPASTPVVVDSNGTLDWGPWRVSIQMNMREGLLLKDVQVRRSGRLVSVLSRASLSEVVVPYTGLGRAWSNRLVFDAAMFGLGGTSSPLVSGNDVPEDAILFDAALHDDYGSPRVVPNAVAVFERTSGLAWRTSGASELGRELVIASVAATGGYHYMFQWILREDASIQVEVLLTGVLTVRGIDRIAQRDALHAEPVAPGLAAVHHQHMFTFRLDFDVAGRTNSVYEVEASPSESEHPAAFTAVEQRLSSEGSQAAPARTTGAWWVVNDNAFNRLGGFLVVPDDVIKPLWNARSGIAARGAFVERTMWVTPFAPHERFPAGEFPYQRSEVDGLPVWVRANRVITKEDVVLWLTIGVTHLPRPEEWPVMPVRRVAFQIVPRGIFTSNPRFVETAR
jgi:primary-amine oxidase